MMIPFAVKRSASVLDGALRAPVNTGQAQLAAFAPGHGAGTDTNVILRAYSGAQAAAVTSFINPEFLRHFIHHLMPEHIAQTLQMLSY